jgi:nicotinamide-nucleotide amidase
MTQNTNTTWIAEKLSERGYFPVMHVVVPDDPEKIKTIFQQELIAGRDVIATGGLGPTLDDHTRNVAAALFQQSMVLHEDLYVFLKNQWGNLTTLQDQATQPAQAQCIKNPVGTAPGIILEDKNLFPYGRLFLLPGPPREMQAVAETLFSLYFPISQKSHSKILRIIQASEQEIDPIARQLSSEFPDLQIGIYPSCDIVSIHLRSSNKLPTSMERAITVFEETFSDRLMQEPSIVAALHKILQNKGWTIATAESCTAGALAAAISSYPGASRFLKGSVVAYQDTIKENILKIPNDLLKKHGPVSREVTEKMAETGRMLFGSDIICSTSGYFGPTAGPEAPIGKVFFTCISPTGSLSREFYFQGPRLAICERAVQTILAHLVLFLKKAL